MSWAALAALAAGTYLLKAVGPLMAAERRLAPRVAAATALLPPALLAALVAVQTVAAGRALVVDARAGGLAAAAVAVWLRAPFAVVVLAGMLAAAGLRALGAA